MLRPRESGGPDARQSSSFDVGSAMRGEEPGARGLSSLRKKINDTEMGIQRNK